MLSIDDHRIRQLLDDGLKVAVHAYFDRRGAKFTAVARNPDDGRLYQGWSRGSGLDAAVDELVERVGLELRAADQAARHRESESI